MVAYQCDSLALDPQLPRLTFTPENLTGYYYLDLGNAADFALAEQILVLNQWETLSLASKFIDSVPLRIEEHFGYVDTSQHGNRCHLRNMTYGGRRLPHKDVKQWILPMSEVFSFDYVSCKRPKPTEPTLEGFEFHKFLKTISRHGELRRSIETAAGDTAWMRG